jgi:CBS domain-containing protein
MTTRVVTVDPDACVDRAAALLADHGLSVLPVVDRDGHLVGVVGEVELLGCVRRRDARDPTESAVDGIPRRTVRSVMRRHPVTLTPATPVMVATDLLTCTSLGSLPVVTDGRLVGVLSRSDLVRGLTEVTEPPRGDEAHPDRAWLLE